MCELYKCENCSAFDIDVCSNATSPYFDHEVREDFYCPNHSEEWIMHRAEELSDMRLSDVLRYLGIREYRSLVHLKDGWTHAGGTKSRPKRNPRICRFEQWGPRTYRLFRPSQLAEKVVEIGL